MGFQLIKIRLALKWFSKWVRKDNWRISLNKVWKNSRNKIYVQKLWWEQICPERLRNRRNQVRYGGNKSIKSSWSKRKNAGNQEKITIRKTIAINRSQENINIE